MSSTPLVFHVSGLSVSPLDLDIETANVSCFLAVSLPFRGVSLAKALAERGE